MATNNLFKSYCHASKSRCKYTLVTLLHKQFPNFGQIFDELENTLYALFELHTFLHYYWYPIDNLHLPVSKLFFTYDSQR